MEQRGPDSANYKDHDETIRDLIGLIGAYSGEPLPNQRPPPYRVSARDAQQHHVADQGQQRESGGGGGGHGQDHRQQHQSMNYVVDASGHVTRVSSVYSGEPIQDEVPVNYSVNEGHRGLQGLAREGEDHGKEQQVAGHQDVSFQDSAPPGHAHSVQDGFPVPSDTGQVTVTSEHHTAAEIATGYLETGNPPNHDGGKSIIEKAYMDVMQGSQLGSPGDVNLPLTIENHGGESDDKATDVITDQHEDEAGKGVKKTVEEMEAEHVTSSVDLVLNHGGETISQERGSTAEESTLPNEENRPIVSTADQTENATKGDMEGSHTGDDSGKVGEESQKEGITEESAKQTGAIKCASCFGEFFPDGDLPRPGVLPLCDSCHKRFTSTLPKCQECGKKLTTDESLLTHVCPPKGESFMCEVCGKVFSLAKHLSRHKQTHNPNRNHQCDHCGKRFGRLEHLKRHKLTHSTHKPYMCDKCGKTFSRSDNLNHHKCNTSDSPPRQRKSSVVVDTGEVFPCDTCDKTFPTRQKLNRHKRNHNMTKPHNCDQCDKAFSCISHLKRHQLTHLGYKPYSCDICGKTYGQSSHLSRHILTHSGACLYRCDKCPRFYLQPEELKQHMLSHAQGRSQSSNNSHFTQMIINKDPPPEDMGQEDFPVPYHRQENQDLYCCQLCMRYFNNAVSLNQHQCFPTDVGDSRPIVPSISDSHPISSVPLSHPIRTPNPVNRQQIIPSTILPSPLEAVGLSPKVFRPDPPKEQPRHTTPLPPPQPPQVNLPSNTNNESLQSQGQDNQHSKTDDPVPPTLPKNSAGDEPLPTGTTTTEANQSTEASQSAPANNTVTLTEQEIQNKLFTCKVCGFFCGSLDGLETHIQVHAIERPHKCAECGKRFRRLSHLDRHRLIHTGIKPYACDICDKKFTRPDNLNFHRNTHFKGEECEPVPCGTCGRKYPNVEVFGKHKCVDPATLPHPPNQAGPRIRKITVPMNENCACETCGKVFRSGSRLSRHMLIHSRPNTFKCEVCNKNFNRRDHLKRHQLTHSGLRPYGCTVCSRRFMRNDHLQYHMRSHNGSKGRGRPPVKKTENAFFCHVCGMRFSKMEELDQHECNSNDQSQNHMSVPKQMRRISRRRRKSKLRVGKRKVRGAFVKDEPGDDAVGEEGTSQQAQTSQPASTSVRRVSGVLMSDESDEDMPPAGKETIPWDHDTLYPNKKIQNLEPREMQHRSCREEKLHICDVCGNVFHALEMFLQHKLHCAYNMPQTPMMYYEEHEPEPEPENDVNKGQNKMDSSTSVAPEGQKKPSHVTCGICSKSFDVVPKLMRHLKTHSQQRKYECDLCHKTFTRSDHLTRHKRTHNEKEFICKKCGEKFQDVVVYRTHLQTHQSAPSEKPYSCSICQMSFTKHTTLIKHKLSHNVEGQHQCKKCGDVFAEESLLEAHECSQDTEKIHSCVECGKSFKTVYSLTRHLFCHSGSRPFECDECGKSFSRRGHLRRHKTSHSDEKPFSCDVCEKKFRRVDHLRIHKRIHERKESEGGTGTGAALIPCDICNKKFRSANLLEKHKIRHTVERRYMCDTCGKTFKRMDNLKMHKRIHTGEKPHSCQECGKMFTHHTALRGHMRTHSDEQPYVCEICGRAFKHPHNMRSHQYTHGVQKPFSCQFCQKPFRDTYHLRLHISRCHNPDRVKKPRGTKGQKSSVVVEQKPVITPPTQVPVTSSQAEISNMKKISFPCERCHLVFPSVDQLHSHQCHPYTVTHPCTRCDRTFQDPHQLRLHLLTHKEEPSVICAISAIQENYEEPQVLSQRYQIPAHHEHAGPLAYSVPHQAQYMLSQSNQLAYTMAHSIPNARSHGEVPSYQML